MCRYATSLYKQHYACFKCRKTFKRRLMWDINRGDERTVEAKCPQCGELMANMGKDFASPKKNDVKQWQHIQNLYAVGIAFHSCGCTGPGYIPNTTEKLVSYLEELKTEYQYNLDFWRAREEPVGQKEIDRDKNRNWEFITRVPGKLGQKQPVANEEAKNYWLGRIQEVERKLEKMNAES